MLTRRSLRKLVLIVIAALLASVPVALAATPRAGSWMGRITRGGAMKGAAGRPTFTVRGATLERFSIGGVDAFCVSSYTVVPVYVPSAKIRSGRFSTTYYPDTGGKVQLSGRFVSRRTVRGAVSGSGAACSYRVAFIAHHR